ncbi:MAG TPA: hypothetical protein EYM79_04105 [Planctomycetes bacterium]|nr:hypothetical protein [Planctomycetota bacterium]
MASNQRQHKQRRLQVGEKLEDRRLLAYGICGRDFGEPNIPSQITAFNDTVQVGEVLAGTRKQVPRVGLINTSATLPSQFSLSANILTTVQNTTLPRCQSRTFPTSAILTIDYLDDRNFKFAGFDAARNLWLIGERINGRTRIHQRLKEAINRDRSYHVQININVNQLQLVASNEIKLTHIFPSIDRNNPAGLGSLRKAPTQFQNVALKDYFPEITTLADSFKIKTNASAIVDVLANDQIAQSIDAQLVSTDAVFAGGTATIVDDQIQLTTDGSSFGTKIISYSVADQFGRRSTEQLEIVITAPLPLSLDVLSGSQYGFNVLQGKTETITVADSGKSLHRLTGLETIGIGAPPTHFSIATTLVANPNNQRANGGGYIVFDLQDKDNYRFAGVIAGQQTITIGEVYNGRTFHLRRLIINKPSPYSFDLQLVIDGPKTRLVVNQNQYIAYQFDSDVTGGLVGLKGHRRGSHFHGLEILEFNAVDVVDTQGSIHVPVHEQVVLETVFPAGTTYLSAAAEYGNILIENNQLVYTSGNHHWGPDKVEVSVLLASGESQSQTLNVNAGISFPMESRLVYSDYLENPASLSQKGLRIAGHSLFQNPTGDIAHDNTIDVSNFTLVHFTDELPADFDIRIQLTNPTKFNYEPELIVFDYVDALNYKFAGLEYAEKGTSSFSLWEWVGNKFFDNATTKWLTGEVINGERHVYRHNIKHMNLANGTHVIVKIRGNTMYLSGQGKRVNKYSFDTPLNRGQVGVYAPTSQPFFYDMRVLEPDSYNDNKRRGIKSIQHNTALSPARWTSNSTDSLLEVQPSLTVPSINLSTTQLNSLNSTISTTITIPKIPGMAANGFIVFDYQNVNSFKVAGIRVGAGDLLIGQYRDGVLIELKTRELSLDNNTAYRLDLTLEPNRAQISLDDHYAIVYEFNDYLLINPVGVGTLQSSAFFTTPEISP